MTERSHRRKLGQNYLIDPVILFEIEQAINPQKNNLFFEIGPGTGALTEKLLRENIKIIRARAKIEPTLEVIGGIAISIVLVLAGIRILKMSLVFFC